MGAARAWSPILSSSSAAICCSVVSYAGSRPASALRWLSCSMASGSCASARSVRPRGDNQVRAPYALFAIVRFVDYHPGLRRVAKPARKKKLTNGARTLGPRARTSHPALYVRCTVRAFHARPTACFTPLSARRGGDAASSARAHARASPLLQPLRRQQRAPLMGESTPRARLVHARAEAVEGGAARGRRGRPHAACALGRGTRGAG